MLENYLKKEFDEIQIKKTAIIEELYSTIKDFTVEKTKLTYENRIKSINKYELFPFNGNLQIILKYIESVSPSESISTYLTVINQILKFACMSGLFNQDVGVENSKILMKLSSALHAQSKIDQKKIKENDITWSYLLSLEKILIEEDYTKDEKLLYGLYVKPTIGICPRNDFGNVKIVNKIEETENTNFNYFIKNSNKFILNNYKTANKYGQIVRDVPADIVQHISLDQNFLFEKAGKKLVEDTLSKKVQRLFTKLSGTNITINTIRRAYASNHKSENVCLIVDDAESMMHSVSEHINYQHNL